MPGEATGRNDPCPCGSGKKYKKCCLAKDTASAPKVVEPEPAELCDDSGEDLDRLEHLADQAREALHSGRNEETEDLAARLLAQYPKEIDGLEIRAHLREHQGRWSEAAADYQAILDLILREGDEDIYDDWFLDEIRAATARAQERAGSVSRESSADARTSGINERANSRRDQDRKA